MARLNEPPLVSADTIESLRRKFLRQNRDIARINQAQGVKIRDLENEIARLLTENLELTSHNIRLKKAQEDNSAQRTADHALALKAKMEAQLIEWGAMLSTLGVEPPLKRHSPDKRRGVPLKGNLHREPVRRRPREYIPDSEELAEAEGRLGPLFEEPENRPHQRQTLNHEEIVAMMRREESAPRGSSGSAASPDIGPPPVSRYVDEEPIVISSPFQPKTSDDAIMSAVSAITSPERLMPRRDESYIVSTAEPQKKTLIRATEKPALPKSSSQPAKVGAKRKYGACDENDISATVSKDTNENTKPSRTADTPVPGIRIKSRRPIKDLTANRKETKEKVATALLNSANAMARKPLGAKSTNDDIVSPKKTAILAEAAGMKKPKTLDDVVQEERGKDRPRAKRLVEITMRPPQVAPVKVATIEPPPAEIVPDAEAESYPTAPDTPDRFTSERAANDTPPPADISSQGETSRPNRRARASVSYAEPNLRDKMRRPTKELFDAVAGEGKRVARPSTKAEELHAEAPSATKKELSTDVLGNGKAGAIAEETADKVQDKEAVSQQSPPARPALSIITSVTERRKRPSSTIEVHSPLQRSERRSSDLHQLATGPIPMGPVNRPGALDPYEFNVSSPATSPREDTSKETAKEVPTAARATRHRRSAATHETTTAERTVKIPASRKRASMAGPKKAAMYEDDDADDDSSYKDDSSGLSALSTRDRATRRRSMMI